MVAVGQQGRRPPIIELLNSSSYFTGFEPHRLKKIGRLMVKKVVAKDEIIWLEQDRSKMIYVVASGLIKLFKTSAEGKEQTLRLVRPGNCFGHTGVFNGDRNPESAQALAPTLLYGLRKTDLETLLRQQKQLAFNIIKALSIEMHHYMSLIEDLSLRRVSGRVARLLLEYSSENILDVSLIRTHGDIAAMTGTAREVVGKSLKALERKGVIKLNGRRIVIRDHETLKILAN